MKGKNRIIGSIQESNTPQSRRPNGLVRVGGLGVVVSAKEFCEYIKVKAIKDNTNGIPALSEIFAILVVFIVF